MRIIVVWLLNAVALWIVAHVVPGVQVGEPLQVLLAALVLGLVSAIIKPVLVLLTLPVTILTLGLFLLVLNGLLFWGVAALLKGFYVAGFWPGVLGALLYSILTWIFSLLIPGKR